MIGYSPRLLLLALALVAFCYGMQAQAQAITSADLDYLLTACARLKLQLATLRTDSTELQAKLIALQDRLLALSQDLEVSRAESTKLAEQLATLNADFLKLKADIDALRFERDAWRVGAIGAGLLAAGFLVWALAK